MLSAMRPPRAPFVVGLAASLLLAAQVVGSGCASSGTAGQARVGGTSPYRVNGKTYVPMKDWRGYREEGVASWYGAAHHGKKTANGERFDAHGAHTAAHRRCPSTSAPRSRTCARARASSSASTTAAPSRRAA